MNGLVDCPAFRVRPGDRVRHANRQWRVVGVDLVARYGTRTRPVADVDRRHLRFTLRSDRGATTTVTVNESSGTLRTYRQEANR